jgi:iron complex transport system ATP-binding protein
MPLPSPILHISGLRVARVKNIILHGLDWRVQRGEHWAILGANGCGKTTLLKALLGYLSPSAGDISLLGEHYGETDWRELRLKIGIVTSALQASVPAAEPAIETVVSGRYAQLDLWLTPTHSDLAAAKKLLRLLGATHLINREWQFLSQGERQRILIARALIARPRLLILDEPCAGLDPVAREDFLRFLEKLARRKNTPALILVTHHVEEILPCFTHALLLRAGRAVAAGPRTTTLTTRQLSITFGAPLRLRRRAGRYALSFAAPRA